MPQSNSASPETQPPMLAYHSAGANRPGEALLLRQPPLWLQIIKDFVLLLPLALIGLLLLVTLASLIPQLRFGFLGVIPLLFLLFLLKDLFYLLRYHRQLIELYIYDDAIQISSTRQFRNGLLLQKRDLRRVRLTRGTLYPLTQVWQLQFISGDLKWEEFGRTAISFTASNEESIEALRERLSKAHYPFEG